MSVYKFDRLQSHPPDLPKDVRAAISVFEMNRADDREPLYYSLDYASTFHLIRRQEYETYCKRDTHPAKGGTFYVLPNLYGLRICKSCLRSFMKGTK